MASLMENLIDVLNKQYEEYVALVELSRKKTPIIVKGDLQALQDITDEEQLAVSRVNHYDRERAEVMKDIANVINKDVEALKITDLVDMLAQRPEEQKQLAEVRDRLRKVALEMKDVNERNGELLQNSLDMVNFDMTLLQSLKRAPETANYTKGAYSSGNVMGVNNGNFDAKQ